MGEFDHLRVPRDAVRIDPEHYASLPASAQKIFECILQNGALSHQGLWSSMRMSPRTIRFALRRLRDERFVDRCHSLRDARTCYFFVHPRLIAEDHIAQQRSRAPGRLHIRHVSP